MVKKIKDVNKIKFIILNFGYVESAHPYSWIFKHNIGFQTKFEAAQSLALEYYHVYNEKHPITQIKECCLSAQKNNDNFCKDCGYRISQLTYDLVFAEKYKDWLWENCKAEHNESEVSEYFSDYSDWRYVTNEPFDITKENSLYIGSAERVLTGLLYDTGLQSYCDEDILSEILSNTTPEKFKISFEKEEGPNVYK